jgi:hypothetical protein
MHALLVERKLVCGNIIRGHQFFIRVATSAHSWYIRRVNARSRIIGLKNLMSAVAIKASSYVFITLFQANPMNTFFIFVVLVGG